MLKKRLSSSKKRNIRCLSSTKRENSILGYYEFAYNQETKDIDKAISTLKRVKNQNLKEKYKKYLETNLVKSF